MKLIDASSWIEFLRGRTSNAGIQVKELLLHGNTAWCEMTLVELWNGARGQKEQKALNELEWEVTLCPVNEQVWALACDLARSCRAKALTVTANDIVVAACARQFRLMLAHCDKHFDKIIPIADKL